MLIYLFSLVIFLGKDCVDFLESTCTADIGNLEHGSGTLTVFTNETGGILDDLIVTKVNDDLLYVVSNAARKNHDQQHLLKALVREGIDKNMIFITEKNLKRTERKM